MTYLSRIRLNPTRRGTQKLLASPQAMHAAVMGSHPRFLDDRVSGRVLWRIDQPAKHDIQVYVVSPVTPDFTGLLEQAGWPTQPDWDSTEYQPFLDMLDTGQVWRFRVTANPVRVLARTPGDTRRRGRISPHVTADQQRDWLIKSGPHLGVQRALARQFRCAGRGARSAYGPIWARVGGGESVNREFEPRKLHRAADY